jgi:hypothetical protein
MTRTKTHILLGISLWVSFLGAGVATMFFFATFDPSELANIATYPMQLGASTGYSLGFFLFWLLLTINSAVVLWLAGVVDDREASNE